MRRLFDVTLGFGCLENDAPLTVVAKGMTVVLVAAVLTLFVPGLIAVRDHVFLDTEIQGKLPPSAARSLQVYSAQRSRLSSSVVSLSENLDLLGDPHQQKDFDFYVHVLDERQKEPAKLQPPVFTKGFFLSPQMLLWPAIYTSLGCLLFCYPHSTRTRSRSKKTMRIVSLGAFIYLYYEWPLWTRNFLLGSFGRTVYAYSNYDIDPKSFLVQELMIAGFATLIGAVWLQWLDLAANAKEEAAATSESDINYLNVQFILSLQRAFFNWIINSIVLGLGFVYFTTFFWSLVATYHDERYIVSAFLAHSLWALTWVFLSMPAIILWRSLKARRLKTIENLIKLNQSTPGKSEQLNLEGLEKLESIAGIRMSLAGAGAVFSLILPLLQLFLHKS